MQVLALEPFYGGSHRAFLDAWAAGSRHDFTVVGLPARRWKWRMRHAALTCAERASELLAEGRRFDLVWASDMLNLAEFVGLAPSSLREVPQVLYFHENQLTYPDRERRERDLHFAFSNFTSAVSADRVWFNSEFHRDEWIGAVREWLGRMPDYRPLGQLNEIVAKTSVEPPGVKGAAAERPADREPGPLRVLWNARWEHDKGPEEFFAAVAMLAARGVPFRLLVVGESFGKVPPIFERAARELAPSIETWGYQAEKSDYLRTLGRADVVVSTARHEFFGIAVVEAILAGCYPLLPRRLSYPELLEAERGDADRFFYDGSPEALAGRLAKLAQCLDAGWLEPEATAGAARRVARFAWSRRGPELDRALEEVVTSYRPG